MLLPEYQDQKHISRFLPKQSNAGSFVSLSSTYPMHGTESEIHSTPVSKVYGIYSCLTRMLECASEIV